MNFWLYKLILIGTLLILSKNLEAQWIQTNGPNGGPINGITGDNTYIYASTHGYIFRSADKGKTWSECNRLDTLVISADPLIMINSILVAGTHGAAVYRSYNNGESWVRWNSGLENANHIWDFLSVGDSLFAATNDGVYLSTNYGKDWLEQNSGLTTSFALSLAYTDGILFVGTWGGGVFRSEDKGQNWTAANNGLTSDIIQCLEVNDSIIFAGTWGGNGVYRSVDYGTTWDAINYGLFNPDVNALIFNNDILFAGTHGGIFCSTDYAEYWYPPADGPNSAVNCFHISGTTFLAGAHSGIYLSTDNGDNWTYSITGLKNSNILALAKCKTNLMAGASGIGLCVSNDNGITWNETNLKCEVFSIAVSDTTIFAGSFGEVYSSTDNGEHWAQFSLDLTMDYVRCLIIKDNNVFAGTNGDGVFISIDGTESWAAVDTGLTDSIIYSFATRGIDLYSATENGVFLTEDNGKNWKPVHNGLTGTPVQTLTLCGSNLFAGTANGGVFRLNDEGNAWIAVNSGLTEHDVRTLVTDGVNMFAGTMRGVFLSDNEGENWKRVDEGIREQTILSLQATDSNLYAGTGGCGIWKRPLSEMVTVVANRPKYITRNYVLCQNYPNPFNPSTTIKFDLPKKINVTLKVYSILGEEVATLVSDRLAAGSYTYNWDASNLASGVYLYRFEAEEFVETKKMILMR